MRQKASPEHYVRTRLWPAQNHPALRLIRQATAAKTPPPAKTQNPLPSGRLGSNTHFLRQLSFMNSPWTTGRVQRLVSRNADGAVKVPTLTAAYSLRARSPVRFKSYAHFGARLARLSIEIFCAAFRAPAGQARRNSPTT